MIKDLENDNPLQFLKKEGSIGEDISNSRSSYNPKRKSGLLNKLMSGLMIAIGSTYFTYGAINTKSHDATLKPISPNEYVFQTEITTVFNQLISNGERCNINFEEIRIHSNDTIGQISSKYSTPDLHKLEIQQIIELRNKDYDRFKGLITGKKLYVPVNIKCGLELKIDSKNDARDVQIDSNLELPDTPNLYDSNN